MRRPLLLDLFCGAGGAAVGYHGAGFDVVGVDIKPQPHYPFEFIQANALQVARCVVTGRWVFNDEWASYLDYGVDAIHASPPCQAYSTTRTLHTVRYPALIPQVRALLRESGVPYIIENVVGAPLENVVMLCGSAFGLGVRRHRLFESNVPLFGAPCAHGWQPEPIDVTGGGPSKSPRTDGKGGRSRKPRSVQEARDAMGIDWSMTRAEVNEAVPPAYTEYIGTKLLEALRSVVLPPVGDLSNPSKGQARAFG